MKIGKLAMLSGTTIETVRFYERERLLQPPQRTGANYRIYTQADVDRLTFIRHCRSLDMTLDEIRALLGYADDPRQDCRGVNVLLDEHIDHVAERIRELRALERQLRALRKLCQNESAVNRCGVLQGLSQDAKRPASRQPTEHVHGSHGRR